MGHAFSGMVGLAICGTVLAGCAGSSSTPDQAAAPVVIGAVYNLTGSQAGLDEPSADGAYLKAREVNRQGGVLGRRLRLVVVDGESEPPVIAARTSALLADNPGTSAVMGLSDTDMVLAAAPVAAEAGRVFLTSGATSPELPAQVPEDLYLACFGDNVQAAAAAEFAADTLGARTATVLWDDTDTYTRLLRRYFEESFTAAGGTVLSSHRLEPQTLVSSIPVGEADLVYLAAHVATDAVPVVRRLRAAGYSGPIIGGDGFDVSSVWREHPGIRDVYFTTHAYLGEDNPDPIVRAFREAFTRSYGRAPDAFAALGYDTVGVLVAAAEAGGGADPPDVRRGLRRMGTYNGVTGTISFPRGSRIPSKSVSIIRVDRGGYVLAAEHVPSHVPKP